MTANERLAHFDSMEVGGDSTAGGVTATGNGNATGHKTGPAEGRVGLIFRPRLTQPVSHNSAADPASDGNCAPDVAGGHDSVRRDEQVGALSDLGSHGSPGGSESPPAPNAGKALPGDAGSRPLRKLKLAWQTQAYRASPCTGAHSTACAIKGCSRPPRVRYTDRRTKATTEVCCLDCCYNVRDEDDVKVHTTECDAALEPAPGAHRENDITAAMWHRPWG